jgi:hypothetical protein
MLSPNAVVSSVIRLDPPLDRAPAEILRAERGLSVELEGGRRARLDPANSRSAGFARILDGLNKHRLPVYLEIDPETSSITRLLIPHVSRVLGVRSTASDALDVELEGSHGRHVLRRDLSDFAELEKRLREATHSGEFVVLTEDDAHNIIDVRSVLPGSETPPPSFPKPRSRWRISRFFGGILQVLSGLFYMVGWPWGWLGPLTMPKAQQLFDLMKGTSCDPLTVPAPCIPFLYPDDGCHGRAHEMCRLMGNYGVYSKKVWVHASDNAILHVNTRNNPECFVEWIWHCAPTVRVRMPGIVQSETMVIDPALFTTPVSIPTWTGVLGNPNATLTKTDASIFLLFDPNALNTINPSYDPEYVATGQALAKYRLLLQDRAVSYQPPPYAYCP